MYDCLSMSGLILIPWGRVTHICVVKPTIIGSDSGLSPGRRQAIIWTNTGILSTGPLGTNFIEILIGIQTFSFKKMHLKMSSAKCCQFLLGLNVLIHVCKNSGCWYQWGLNIMSAILQTEMSIFPWNPAYNFIEMCLYGSNWRWANNIGTC